MTHLVGRTIGRYQIQEEIGRGGMARVYRALDPSLQRMVALKVLSPQLAVDPEFAERFQREAITAANLRHPNIVLIFDVGEEDGLRYIAMEFVEGRTLHAIIQERGALGLGPAVSIIEGVGAALDHAHQQGAIHRDIKPHNVMVDIGGRVLLTDFGIAQPPDRGEDAARLTRTGVFMGTPEYISPEQASAQKLDGRSDLYSLGITTYEIITGRVPFSGATPQLIVAHVHEPPPPPTSIDADLPWELDAVMARVLAKRPENRYRTAEAFAEALRLVARKRGYPPATRAQLAALVKPHSTAGQSTVALDRDSTQRSQSPVVVPVVPAPVAAPIAARAAPATAVPATDVAPRTPPPRQRPPVEQTQSQSPRAASVPPRTGGRAVPKPAPPPVGSGPNRFVWFVGIGGAAIIFVLLAFMIRSPEGATPIAPPTSKPAASLMPTQLPTETPTPTATPTVTPSPTATPAPPTRTSVPLATAPPNVVPPPATPVPASPVPPTETPATSETPTDNVQPTAAATELPVDTPDVPTTEPPQPATPTNGPPVSTSEATIPTEVPTEQVVPTAPAIATSGQ